MYGSGTKVYGKLHEGFVIKEYRSLVHPPPVFKGFKVLRGSKAASFRNIYLETYWGSYYYPGVSIHIVPYFRVSSRSIVPLWASWTPRVI